MNECCQIYRVRKHCKVKAKYGEPNFPRLIIISSILHVNDAYRIYYTYTGNADMLVVLISSS